MSAAEKASGSSNKCDDAERAPDMGLRRWVLRERGKSKPDFFKSALINALVSPLTIGVPVSHLIAITGQSTEGKCPFLELGKQPGLLGYLYRSYRGELLVFSCH